MYLSLVGLSKFHGRHSVTHQKPLMDHCVMLIFNVWENYFSTFKTVVTDKYIGIIIVTFTLGIHNYIIVSIATIPYFMSIYFLRKFTSSRTNSFGLFRSDNTNFNKNDVTTFTEIFCKWWNKSVTFTVFSITNIDHFTGFSIQIY